MSTQFARAMRELGITQILRAITAGRRGAWNVRAGTFEDRLVTELRHASASSHPRGTRRTRALPAALQTPASGSRQRSPWWPTARSITALPLASDPELPCTPAPSRATTPYKYHWRTLQLLPEYFERRSYAGTHRRRWWSGRTASSPSSTRGRRSPHVPCTAARGRAESGSLRADPEPRPRARSLSGLGSGGALRRTEVHSWLLRRWMRRATALRSGPRPAASSSGLRLARQLARWKAIQQ